VQIVPLVCFSVSSSRKVISIPKGVIEDWWVFTPCHQQDEVSEACEYCEG